MLFHCNVTLIFNSIPVECCNVDSNLQCTVTLFFNSIHVQCCNVDSNLSVCLFFVVCFFRGP